MDKSQDAIAPPNTTLNEPPPPFPGVGTSSQFSGGFQAPPDSGLVTGKKENNILNIMVIKRYYVNISFNKLVLVIKIFVVFYLRL